MDKEVKNSTFWVPNSACIFHRPLSGCIHDRLHRHPCSEELCPLPDVVMRKNRMCDEQ